jgi:signal transduction histidine kinase
LSAEPGSRTGVEPGLCATEAVRSRAPVFVTSFEQWQRDYPKAASLAADGGYVSSATVPLLVEGAAIGVLAFYFTAPVNFDQEYRELLVSVAQDCAQALDRARLYESAQQARAEAEAANRLKDEFVSIVSHELRSPLTAILGWTAMLRRGDPDGSLTTRALQSIHDNASRQARLIEELLDFSKVTSGHLTLAHEPVKIPDLLQGVVESLIPESVAKGLAVELAPVPPAIVAGDQARLEQVFFNLLGNAMKFTPAGGRVGVEAKVNGQSVDVRVADTGLGIDPEFLPFVFERFRQADDTAGREYGGLGLGLSIARQLVEAHGGAIRVDSEGRGKGAVFTVSLPLAS